MRNDPEARAAHAARIRAAMAEFSPHLPAPKPTDRADAARFLGFAAIAIALAGGVAAVIGVG